MNTIIARYYQFAGRIREAFGRITHNGTSIAIGKHNQLVGRITEFCHLSIEDAELMAREASGPTLQLQCHSRVAYPFPRGRAED
jgi:uncharacterized protein YjbJ (UPF0337 family)